VDFLLGTPEENLSYYRTRVGRFGANYVARFQAPFFGRWSCTQGVDGDRTHQGPWRYGLDFEVTDGEGRVHRGSGEQLEDYHCYRLPVLATADGVVAKVVDGIPDNRPGEVNLEDNWGNLVLLYHGPGLYSLVCHLSPGTIEVQQGQPVRQGDELGLCGASGRAPAPHIHFQLQATARIGAPTLYVELHDVVSQGEGGVARLHSTFVPAEGDKLRNLEPDQEIGRLLSFDYGQPASFAVNGHQRRHEETIVADIDLYGNLLLRSRTLPTTLYYDIKPSHFTVFDTLGRRGSVLQLIQTTLSRVPFEATDELVWRDVLPLRHFLPWWVRGLVDLVSPFVQISRVEVEYRARREGACLRVEGRSLRRCRDAPLVSTTAVLADGGGIEQLEIAIRGRIHRAERIDSTARSDDRGAAVVRRRAR
jgi:murein DD-endopeptidase MepM/ murein hydrolase activator NlpD